MINRQNNALYEDDILKANIQNTDAYFPEDKTLQQFLEEQAVKSPDQTAVSFQGRSFTYEYINSKSNILYEFLRNIKGVKTGEIIGIIAERSPEMIIGIYAIIKAGGVYLPISSEYPAKRIEYLVQDSGIKYILTHNKHSARAENAEMIYMPDILDKGEAVENPVGICGPQDPAYVIYTSGTTGKPKGVVIEHRSVVNRINWMQRMYPLSKKDVILQKTPVVFDVSVWELFWWAFAGSEMCLLKPGMERFPQAIIEEIEKSRITVIHFVPSMLFQFLKYIENTDETDKLSSLRYVFTSGEALSPICVELFNRVVNKKTGARLINLYGPTEATVDVTYFDCPTDGEIEKIPIGKPIDNINICILADGKLQPVGAEGEICISGIGLARGYLNRPELTKEQFISHPLDKDEMLYKTGDLGAFMEDGNIEFHGRKDCQVKIRGLRIELGEIESTIMELPYIKQCAVTNVEKNSDVLLTAFVVADSDIDIKVLKEHLKENLPGYMIPNRMKILDQLPVLPSGKIDRNVLTHLYNESK